MNAEVRPMKTNAELALADIFAGAKRRLPGNDAVKAQRSGAFDDFMKSGLPHRRVEAWKYTDLRAIMRDAHPLAAPPSAEAKAKARSAGRALAHLRSRRMVIVDGAFAADLSDLVDLEAGVAIRSMAEALTSGDALISAYLGKVAPRDDASLTLNTALMGDGVVIHIAPGVTVERPIHLVFISTSDKPAAVFERSLVVVEPRAHLTLLETYEGPDESQYQVNTALELIVGDAARVDHLKMIAEGRAALHVATQLADIGQSATFNDFCFTTGGAVVRNQLFVRFKGQGAVADIRGVSLLAGRQHGDQTLVADHVAPGCESRETFKSVLDDEARAVFQGKINVHPGAQQTNARMMARALLLSSDAEADCKPELEIFADDVQCGHGSTTGKLNDEQKFYLMARGIPAREAEALLIQAFVGEVVEAIKNEGVKEALMNATLSWLR
ncbi:MAG TPA: Fe-S cluster assembly protein SufD [Methylocella sp.]|nr:Fe-S cluster assembly protein SufD [Methylocella sp.]